MEEGGTGEKEGKKRRGEKVVEKGTGHMKTGACYGESERGKCLVGIERHVGKREKNRKGEGKK